MTLANNNNNKENPAFDDKGNGNSNTVGSHSNTVSLDTDSALTNDVEGGKSQPQQHPSSSDILVMDDRHHKLHPQHTTRTWTDISLPEDDDFDETDAHISLVTNEWASGTSVHGAASIADFVTWQLWKRVLWALLVFASGSIMIWQIVRVIQQYREYDTNTKTDTLIPPSLDFPEITICNYQTVSQQLINETGIEFARNREELEMISRPLTDFVYETSFNGNDLNVTQAWKKVFTREGICYSFQTNETVLKAGSERAGLYFAVDIDQADYPPDYGQDYDYAGLLVWAETPGTKVNDQIPYFSAAPGRVSVANLKQTQYKRETDEPWSHCKDTAPQYTQANCRTLCVNKALQEKCACKFDYGDPNHPDLQFCSTEKDYECLEEFYGKEALDVLKNCPQCSLPPCQEARYEAYMTNFEFSDNYLRRLVRKFDGSKEEWKRNLVVVNVNFGRIEYVQVTQTKAMDISTLFGSIGGNMGLFLGISVISIVEVFGDLGAMRLIPRLFGYRNLHGVGARKRQ